MSALTTAQVKALEQLRAGACHRNKEGWITAGGEFVALVVMASLRKRGLANLSHDRRQIRLSSRGRALQELGHAA
jgi:hypothetical protein